MGEYFLIIAQITGIQTTNQSLELLLDTIIRCAIQVTSILDHIQLGTVECLIRIRRQGVEPQVALHHLHHILYRSMDVLEGIA